MIKEFLEELPIYTNCFRIKFLSATKHPLIEESIVASFEVEVPKYLVAEFNRHRLVYQNWESSRAANLKKVIEIMESTGENIYIPSYVTKEVKGMISNVYLEDDELIVYQKMHLEHLLNTINMIKPIMSNYHKQYLGRYLEPFRLVKGIITSYNWDHFIGLRKADRYENNYPIGSVQPEMMLIAKFIDESLRDQKTIRRVYHTPYLEFPIYEGINRCAAISYRNEKPRSDLYITLIKEKHYSPFEHVLYPNLSHDKLKYPWVSERYFVDSDHRSRVNAMVKIRAER